MDGAVLHDIFADAVARWPDRVAIDVPPSPRRPGRRSVTYRELDQQSNGLAHALGSWVAEPDCIVVVLLPRASEHLYVAQLAALKTGAAFTCIDPAFPDGQLQTILDDARAVAVLSDVIGGARLAGLRCGAPVVDVATSIASLPESVPPVTRPAWLSPCCLAYLIYTSGTTGVPKGVMVEHRSIVNLVRGDLATLGVVVDDRVAQHSSPAYDSSIEETWFALAAGATVVVMDDDAARLGPDLAAWLRRERITMFCPPPTLLRSAGCTDPERELPELRLLHPGGEALPQDVADTWAAGRSLVNDYGPTEATITAIRGVIQPGETVSIGRPVPGMEAWVVDEQLQEVPDGERGELCLGGIGLARGYRHAPELTARKFPEHPRLGRIYRTGDLATRTADGRFQIHGRIDTQVKIRGYRIELEAIEARLVQLGGVREAACTVQDDGVRKTLVAFVVFEPGVEPQAFDHIKQSLRAVLPEYMVPSRLGALPQLPRSTSGKLNRRALPPLPDDTPSDGGDGRPRTASESRIAAAVQQALGLAASPPIHLDFFADLGGDSLAAAMAVSRLREDAWTRTLAVPDLYETRSVARLAARVDARVALDPSPDAVPKRDAIRPVGRPAVATLVQAVWLLLGVGITAPLGYVVSFQLLPAMVHRMALATLLLLLPWLYGCGLLVYAVATSVMVVLLKRLLIGTYRPLRAPVWGGFYVRDWIVQRSIRLVPWRLIEATVFQHVVLRALGARIGKRVHIHRGVTFLQGGWDLLDIGDDAAIGQDVTLQLVSLEDGQIVVGPVTIGDGASLEVRAGVGPNTRVGTNAVLSAWSYLPSGGRVPDGERWDGIPAAPAGPAPPPAVVDRRGDLSPVAHGVAMILGRIALGAFVLLPVQLLALAGALVVGLDAAGAVDWLLHPAVNRLVWGLEMALVVAAVPLILVSEAFAMRILGRIRPGVISLWSPAYLRVRLRTEILESAGRWLCSTLLWPVWLRAVGMRVGRGSEVGSISDTVPELVEIGSESFFADGIHLAGPTVSHGAVTLAPVSIGDGVFLGNHAVVGCGQVVPDGVLVGVCTVADSGMMTQGTSWFGHPPFELHNREPVTNDRSLTYEPNWLRYLNRVFWELLRFAVPLVPVGVGLAWFGMLGWTVDRVSMPVLLFAVLPGLELMVLVAPPLFVLGLKWLLLGRVRPGTHALWSCWVSRWDFLYVAWDVCATAGLTAVEGSLLLNAYLRAMGVRLGRHVVLGPGFVQVADPDLLHFENGATVTSLIQAHTFEDRVLKMDVVRVRRQATVGQVALMLYGADIGERAYVMPHSAVMKHERLRPGQSYAGCPTRQM